EGSEQPQLVVNAHEWIDVPAGRWSWTAEAEGYVSARSSTLTIGADDSTEKTFDWPVVPACRVRLLDDRRWQTVSRLDFVSFDYSAVFPLFPRQRREGWIPIGRNLTYSTTPGGLGGIRNLARCRHNQVLEIEPPAPPGPEHQDFLVQVTIGDTVPDVRALDWNELLLSLLSQGQRLPPIAPLGGIWAGGRWSFFFLGVPASTGWKLRIQQPELRTLTEPIETLGGSVREVIPPSLQARVSVDLTIDYRPAREHREQNLYANWCDPDAERRAGVDPCERQIFDHPLTPGLITYRLPSLDTGKYHVGAVVDGELVLGLGSGVGIEIPSSDEVPPPLPVIPLVEHEIWGQILEDGEPIPGSVRIRPSDRSSLLTARERRSTRVFPTDEDLFFRLYYFARLPWVRSMEDYENEGERQAAMGLYPGMEWLEACSHDGYCRTFSYHSRILGEGRMDLEIGGLRKLLLTVVSSESGRPVPGALVQTAPVPALSFDSGELEWVPATGVERVSRSTDSAGEARIRMPMELDEPVRVSKEGFERAEVLVEGPKEMELLVQLEPADESGSEGGVAIRFAGDGQPAAHGFFFAYDEEGRFNYHCSVATDSKGRARFPERCRAEIDRLIFGHPGSSLAVLDARYVLNTGEIPVRRAPGRPLVLEATGIDGRPIPGLPITIRARGLRVGINEMLYLIGKGAQPLFNRTDAGGRSTLRGLDTGGEIVEVMSGDPSYDGSVLTSEALDRRLSLVLD
ncbi:MAG: hypothetical protein MI919_21445, partial [Holophagales bacterium]|nr:hypothetical protein [Holophagales bacterium]